MSGPPSTVNVTVAERDQRAEDLAALRSYRRIILLTDQHSTPFLAKTAISLLRYRTSDIVAVLDTEHVGQTAQQVFGTGGSIPVVDSLGDLQADAILIGIAPVGGKLPASWRDILKQALQRGMDVVSGLHDFLCDDQELHTTAEQLGRRLIDVRRNSWKQTSTAEPFRPECLRIHTVGQDCSVGKMVVSLEVQRGLVQRGVDAGFLATGQTGIMIAGDGIPIDCVVSDFVNGAAESLVRRHEHHDVVVVEGQGCLSHPCFSAVTLGLLHGCAPHGLIFCYEVGRTHVKGLDDVPLLPLKRLLDAYERTASLRHPCQVIGIGMNSRRVTAEEAELERQRVQQETGLPVCDVYRHGADVLVDRVLQLQQEQTS